MVSFLIVSVAPGRDSGGHGKSLAVDLVKGGSLHTKVIWPLVWSLVGGMAALVIWGVVLVSAWS